MQKTIEGLLRSLLYSALLGFSRSDVPDKLEAINIICAPRSQIDAHSAWSRSKLKDMLTSLTRVSGVKFFFLVDALDECEPQDNLGDLATEILWMSRLSNVKLCVSHRPWDVFLRKFEHASILYLDRLTLRDMEKYVRDRLTGVEADVGRHSNFQEQTQPAEKLVRDLANAAEGVFLWTELITKAICSEMRKGKRVEQLAQVMADFPADLDKYFHELIFGRIEKSNRNIKDTAAALKLAVEINKFEQRSKVPKINGVGENSPFARSFVNFWLLSDERLKPGFSWQEHECIAQPCVEVMIGQTVSFLEETCKDLLVLNQRTKEVDFLHRTVFDFLTDKKADVALEEDAPAHFSDENFLFNLAKLRCICILREARTEVEAITRTLDHILQVFQNVSHLDKNASWLLACESLTILQLQKVHGFRGQGATYNGNMPSRCVKAGLGKFVLEFYKHVPAFVHTKPDDGLDLLGELLQAATNADVRSPDIALYRCIMEHGCNPNAHVDEWPTHWSQRRPFGSKEHYNRGFEWCVRTTWQAWLGEAYLQTQRRVIAGSSAQIDRVLDMQKQWFGTVVDLLQRHGADTSCTSCITDHEEDQEGPRTITTCSDACHHVALEQLLGQIVPTECVAQLQTLRKLCCDETIACIIRRKRQKQAVRSLLISEQNLSTKPPRDVWMPLFTKERLRRRFFESLTGAGRFRFSSCNACSRRFQAALATWCVECQSLSSICLNCSLQRSSEVPGLPSPCTNLTVPRASQDEDHTGVVFVWEREDSEDLNIKVKMTTRMRGYADILHARYPTDHAIDVLKDWYNKNPIEPDLTFEEATHDIASLLPPSGQHQISEDDTTGGSSAEVPPRNAIKRSRTGIEDSEVVSKRHTAVHTHIPTRRGSQEVLASESPGEAST